jgi:protein gp37
LSFLALCAEVAGEQVPITVDFMQRSGRDEWPLPNVWLGISAEDQPRADERIPELLATPAAMRFVSYEPALGPVDFTNLTFDADTSIDALRRHGGGERPRVLLHDALDWIIVGGESGPGARPFKVEWVESVIAQCKRARTACFIKQLGGHVITNGIQPAGDWWPKQSTETEEPSGGFRKRLVDKKGGDMTEWRPSLRVRQFPDAQRAT